LRDRTNRSLSETVLSTVLASLLLPGAAHADDVNGIVNSIDLGDFQSASDEAGGGISVKDTILKLASGDTLLDENTIPDLLAGLRDQALSRLGSVFAAFLLPLIVAAVIRQAAGKTARVAVFLCAMVCALTFTSVMTDALNASRALLSQIAAVTGAVLPVLTALTALAGATSTAALISPMTALAGKLIVDVLGGWGIFLSSAACALACAAAFSSALRLDGIFSLLKSVTMWGAGILLALFVGLLTVQGMLGASYDSATVRTARYAVDNLIPVIGGDLADSLDAAVSSVLLVKSASGLTGMLIVVAACGAPLVRLAATMFAIRLANAVAMPVSDSDITGVVSRFADVLSMLLTISMVAVMLALVMTGAAINAGRGVVR
jgi:stage III sporulation protein AE